MILSSSASIQNMLMIQTSCISAAIPLQLHYKMTLTQPIHGPVKMTWSSMQQRPRSCVLISANLGDLLPSYILAILLLRLSAIQKFWELLSMMTSNGTYAVELVLCRRAGIPSNKMLLMHTTKIRPVLEYACAAWHPGLTQYLTDNIERVQIRAMRIIFPGLSYGDALVCSQLPTLKDRRNDICLSFFKSMEKSDHKLHHLFPNFRISRYSLRKPRKYESAQTKTNRADGALVNWCLKYFSNSI